jgi:hypothetical protein
MLGAADGDGLGVTVGTALGLKEGVIVITELNDGSGAAVVAGAAGPVSVGGRETTALTGEPLASSATVTDPAASASAPAELKEMIFHGMRRVRFWSLSTMAASW